MKVIISPAKKMRVDTDSFSIAGLPRFLPQTRQLLAALRRMEDSQLQALWGCNNAIAEENTRRIREMELTEALTPALLAYEGIQYQYMAPGVFEDGELDYIAQHLAILSGFYGLLRPLDGVVPYRLEMQARLRVEGCRNLYTFWGNRLAGALAEECGTLINLASREYSRAVLPHLPEHIRVITCTFGDLAGGKVVEKGTLCKMARGRMVRFMAENRIQTPEQLREFDGITYAYSREHSTPGHYVFLRLAAAGSTRPAPEF